MGGWWLGVLGRFAWTAAAGKLSRRSAKNASKYFSTCRRKEQEELKRSREEGKYSRGEQGEYCEEDKGQDREVGGKGVAKANKMYKQKFFGGAHKKKLLQL